jgi:hypothetical protein
MKLNAQESKKKVKVKIKIKMKLGVVSDLGVLL